MRFNDELESKDLSFLTFGDHSVTIWELKTKNLELRITCSKYVEDKILYGIICIYIKFSWLV